MASPHKPSKITKDYKVAEEKEEEDQERWSAGYNTQEDELADQQTKKRLRTDNHNKMWSRRCSSSFGHYITSFCRSELLRIIYPSKPTFNNFSFVPEENNNTDYDQILNSPFFPAPPLDNICKNRSRVCICCVCVCVD